jgi:hypothetical protein
MRKVLDGLKTAPQILNLFEESAIFAEQADPLVLRAPL